MAGPVGLPGVDRSARPDVEPAHQSPAESPARRLTGSGPDEVYLARRTIDGVEVAIRIYGRPLRTERDQVRFAQELNALGRLSQVPHVVRVHDGGVLPDGRAYVVTEFCAAGSIEDYVVMVGRLTPAEVCRIGAKLAGALMAAHRLDVFHRNLKPANVLINDAGEPMLSDFAMLSVTGSDPASLAPPTPRPFVAPEAYLPELMSAAADIYSLGATLYALLSGRPPSATPRGPNPPGTNPPGANPPGANSPDASSAGTDSLPGDAGQAEEVGLHRLDLPGLPSEWAAATEPAGTGAAGTEPAKADPARTGAHAGPAWTGTGKVEPVGVGAVGAGADRTGSGGAGDGARTATRAYRVAEGRAVFVDGERLAELPYVPWALMAVLRQAMAHDPQDRFATAEDFQTALLTAV
jgi:serine/threonine protein kinase